MNIAEIELASRCSWPALEEQELPIGILRYAAGVSRRSNSMTPRLDCRLCAAELIDTTESFFTKRRLPSTVRILDGGLKEPQHTQLLDNHLAASDYRLEAPASVMTLQLSEIAPRQLTPGRSSLQEQNLQNWLGSWLRVKQLQAEMLPIHQAMLAKISDPSRYLAHTSTHGNPLATGMAVYANGGLGIFGIATHQLVRRRGLGAGILADLLHWGCTQGARYAYLQVESDNHAAVNLYRKHGFTELYSYWYRVKH